MKQSIVIILAMLLAASPVYSHERYKPHHSGTHLYIDKTPHRGKYVQKDHFYKNHSRYEKYKPVYVLKEKPIRHVKHYSRKDNKAALVITSGLLGYIIGSHH